MVIAITGANGYLGRNLANYFIRAGHQVIKLVRQPEASDERLFILGEIPEADVFSGIDVLVHAAFDFSIKNYAKSYQVNVEGTVKLFQTACSQGVKDFVYISSISAFDECISNYGKVKFSTENELSRIFEHNLYILRPGLIWGESFGGVMQSLKKIASLPIIPLVGANVIQYLVHYDDVAKSILHLTSAQANEQHLITLAYPEQYKFSDILKILGAGVIIPVPWKIVLYLLKFLESMKLDLRTGSDNLISLMNQNKNIIIDTKLFDWGFTRFQ
jgi:nucleoside-diphosphate-sugar epimerase